MELTKKETEILYKLLYKRDKEKKKIYKKNYKNKLKKLGVKKISNLSTS